MKLAAKLSITVVVLLAILVGAAVYLLGSLDAIVKAAIEEHGTRVTQTKVGVAGVKIELTKGAGSISGITVANPSGFTQPKAFKLGNISTAIDTATVTEDPVVIKEIMVRGPEIYYEINKDGTANFDVIQENVKKATAGGAKDEGKEVKLIINRLVIEGGKVSATIAALGGKPLEASMPRIVLTDIGKKEGGATGAEVAKQVADAVIAKTKSSVTALGVDKYLGVGADVIKKQLEAVGGDPSKLLEGGAGATEGIGDKLKDVAPTDTMKKLFQ